MTKKDSDFNDLAAKKGPKAVREKVTSVIDADKGTPYGCFVCKWPNGVFRLVKTDEDSEPDTVFQFSALKPEKIVRTENGTGHAIACKMIDLDGREKTIIFTQEMLHRSGGEEAKVLFTDAGGYFSPGVRTRTLLTDYVQSVFHYARRLMPRARLVKTPGWHWHKDACCYVTYSKIYGSLPGEQAMILPPTSGTPDNSVKGSLADAQDQVLRFAVGNSRMVFSVSLAIAGALLRLVGAEGGGFLLIGLSGCGKSTMLFVGAACTGPIDSRVLSFNLTPTFFETCGLQNNDATFFVDEIGQSRPGKIGDIAYQGGNGQGAGRAKTDGSARDVVTYKALYFSTGETSAADLQVSAGLKYHEGQELRLLTIPADAGMDMGVFEELHGFESAEAFAGHLNRAVKEYHGALQDAFMQALVPELNDPEKRRELITWLHEVVETFCKIHVPAGSAAQVARAARRFAVVACAGELATRYGLTTWPVGEALRGVGRCFEAWLERRGTPGHAEILKLLQQVSGFFERFGESRFQPMDSKSRGTPPPNRAGFRRNIHVGDSLDPDAVEFEFFVLPEIFKTELCDGFDPRWASKILIEKGILRPDSCGKSTSPHRLPGLGLTRCYWFTSTSNQDPDNPKPGSDITKSPF